MPQVLPLLELKETTQVNSTGPSTRIQASPEQEYSARRHILVANYQKVYEDVLKKCVNNHNWNLQISWEVTPNQK